jgi:hypothetical protein
VDSVPEAEIWGFCRLGSNRLKFYRTKTLDIMTENQKSAGYRFIENKQNYGKVVISIRSELNLTQFESWALP